MASKLLLVVFSCILSTHAYSSWLFARYETFIPTEAIQDSCDLYHVPLNKDVEYAVTARTAVTLVVRCGYNHSTLDCTPYFNATRRVYVCPPVVPHMYGCEMQIQLEDGMCGDLESFLFDNTIMVDEVRLITRLEGILLTLAMIYVSYAYLCK
jgi:hypothetical protein